MKGKWWNSLFLIVLILGLILRAQNFDFLPIDGHAMRQTDTESVAYNFAFNNGNILYPQNSLIRPVTNINAYFFLEFPAYQYLISLFYRLFGWHIELARLVNLALFSISLLSLNIFTKKLFKSEATAFFSSFFYTFAPGSIFFLGHAIHPDVFAVAMYLVSLFSFLKWKEGQKGRWLLVSLMSLSLSVATRPFILIGLPAYLYLLWLTKSKLWEYVLYLFFSPLIYGFWTWWQIPFKNASSSWENWVLGGRSQLYSVEILVNRLILKNIIGEVMGKVASFVAGLGIIRFFVKKDKELLFVIIWLLFVPIYWLIVPNGNIIHQYYADIYLIPVVILAGYGMTGLIKYLWSFNKIICLFTGLIVMILTVYNGKRTSQYYFNDLISLNQREIAKEIGKVIPKGAKIVYLAKDNSIPFSLYHRKGWMLGNYPVDIDSTAKGVLSLKSYGAEYVIEGKDNMDLPQNEYNILLKNTELLYSSEWIKVYKYK